MFIFIHLFSTLYNSHIIAFDLKTIQFVCWDFKSVKIENDKDEDNKAEIKHRRISKVWEQITKDSIHTALGSKL